MKSFHSSFDLYVLNICKMKSVVQITIRCILIIMINCSLVSKTFSADIDWRLMKDIRLNDPPIDVVASFDGSYIFILTAKYVLVYASSVDKVVNRIPLSNAFDKLSYSGAKNELILTGTNSKALRIIKIYPLYQIDTDGVPSVGLPNAPVTVVVFDDYLCSACAMLENILKDVLQIYPEEVNLKIKPFPSSNHDFAMKAAVAARAAHGQGKFWEFHRALFEKQASLNDDTIKSIAKQLGLDITKFNQDLHSKNIKAMVDRDLREGRQLGIHATPTIFINGKHLERISFGDITDMIEAELN